MKLTNGKVAFLPQSVSWGGTLPCALCGAVASAQVLSIYKHRNVYGQMFRTPWQSCKIQLLKVLFFNWQFSAMRSCYTVVGA